MPIEENSDMCFETTIGQLNFFKWALENNIIDYIEKNYDEIQNDMDENNSLSKTRKNKNELCGKTRKKEKNYLLMQLKHLKKKRLKLW